MASITEKQKTNKTLWVKTAITFGVPLIILLIPINEVFTRDMRLAIVFTVWLLLWAAFELSDNAIPSLMWPAFSWPIS